MAKKKFISLLCAAAIIFTAACGNTEGPAEPTTAQTTTNTMDDDVRNPVDISEIIDENAKKLENPNITYFGFYDMRVAGDVKPGVKLFEETYGGKIDYITVAWGDRNTMLATLIQSGDSPDLFDKEDITFPHMVSANMFEDLTGYIDLDSPHWAAHKEIVEQYRWNGKQYYYPHIVGALPNVLMYNKTVFDEYAIDDPREYYLNGSWTWDTFKEMMIKFMDQGGEDVLGGVYGLLGNDIILSTGTPIIGFENGKITNNLNSAAVDRAAFFLEELRKERLTVRGEGMWSNEEAPLALGKVAFLGVGNWKITDFIKNRPESEFGFVPYPRDPQADKYYYAMSTFGYMVPSGSQNIEGATAFIDIMRQTFTDPELAAVTKQSVMNDKQYSEEDYDFLDSFSTVSNLDVVLSIAGGLNEVASVLDEMLINVAFEQSEPLPWSSLRASYEYLIQTKVDEYNALALD